MLSPTLPCPIFGPRMILRSDNEISLAEISKSPLEAILMRRLSCRVVFGLVLANGCASSDDTADRSRRCLELRNHIVELRVIDGAGPGVDIEAHRIAMQRALGVEFVDACRKDLSETQIE